MASGDFTGVSTDELVRLVKASTADRKRHEQALEDVGVKQGLLIAELVQRPGWTYLKLAQVLGIDDSTLHRIARRAQEKYPPPA